MNFPLGFVPIPYEIFVNPGLSHGAKLLFGRLKLYAGADGRCNPSHETLAGEICVRTRQVRTLLAELRAAGLVDWKRTRGASFYTFLERQKTAALEGTEMVEIGRKLPVRSAENCLWKRSLLRESTSANEYRHKTASLKPTFTEQERDAARLALGEHYGQGVPDENLLYFLLSHCSDVAELLGALEALPRIARGWGYYRSSLPSLIASRRANGPPQPEQRRRRVWSQQLGRPVAV